MPFDGFGLGLAAKISGLWPKGWGDARGAREAGLDQPGGPRSAFSEAMDHHPDNPDSRVPPDPGGHLETNNLTGSQTWVGDDGTRLHGQEAVDKFLQYSDGSSNAELARQGWDTGGGGGGVSSGGGWRRPGGGWGR